MSTTSLSRPLGVAAAVGAAIGTVNSPLYSLSIAQLPGVQAFESGGRDPFVTHAALGALRDALSPLLTFGTSGQVAHLYGRLNAVSYLAIFCALLATRLVLTAPGSDLSDRHRAYVRGGFWIATLGLAITLFGNLLDYWVYFQVQNILQEISFAITCQGLVLLGLGGCLVGAGLRRSSLVPRWAANIITVLPIGGFCLYASYLFVLRSRTLGGVALAIPTLAVWLGLLAAFGAIGWSRRGNRP